jgi:hypothetical protein
MYAPGFTQGRRSSSDDDSWCRIASAPAFGGGLSKNWDAVCCGILLDYFTFLASRPEHFSGRAGLKKFLLFRIEKILPMTIPLDASGLNFRVGLGLGPGLGGPHAYFIADNN